MNDKNYNNNINPNSLNLKLNNNNYILIQFNLSNNNSNSNHDNNVPINLSSKNNVKLIQQVHTNANITVSHKKILDNKS